MAVIKNMIVRVGADMSGLISGFNKSGKAVNSFKSQTTQALRDSTLSLSNLKKAMASGGKNDAIVSLTDQIRELGAEQKALKAAGFSWGYEGFEGNEKLLRSLKSQLQDYIDELENTGETTEETTKKTSRLGQAARSAFSWLKQAGAKVFGFGKQASGSTSGVEKLLRSIRRIGIVSVGLRLTKSLFGELQSIVSQYVTQNTALQAQVNTLKSSLGQALAPAINLVTNALSKAMPYIIGVSNAIGTLITNLFGSGWTTVADGANAAAGAIGGATSAQEKFNRTLAGFDEITTLGSKNSAGGGGGASSSTTKPVAGKTPEWMTSLTDKITEAFRKGDYRGIGAAVADGINLGISTIKNSDISLGSKLANVINNGVLIAQGLIFNLDWRGLGTAVSTNVRDALSGINWAEIFRTLGGLAGGIGAALWSAFGDGINSAFESFKKDLEDTGGDVMLAIGLGIGRFLRNIGTWVKDNVFVPFVDGFKTTFNIHSPAKNEEIVSLGENIMGGIFNGIKAALSDPVGWVKENVFTPLKNGFSKVFGKDFSITSWFSKNSSESVSVNVKANVNSWKDNLKSSDKQLTFKANVTKGWTGTLASKLGISSITSKLNMQLPKISINWDYTTVFGKTFKYPTGFNIKWNEYGAILRGAQLFGRVGTTWLGGGEAGREAVLPLDRHTGWMDKIADRVALRITSVRNSDQSITINLVLDGKIVAQTVVKNINAQARATGKNPLAAYL